MDRVHTCRVERYGNDRDDQECRGGAVEEHADDEQDYIDDHEEHNRILAEREQSLRKHLRDLFQIAMIQPKREATLTMTRIADVLLRVS